MEPQHLHSRQINIDSFHLDGDRMLVVGKLEDNLAISYPNLHGGRFQVGQVHDMTLELEVRVPDLTIVEARTKMSRVPVDDCQEVIPAVQQIVGLSVGNGFTREVRQRLGSVRGCAHLGSLITAMAPAIMQGGAALSGELPPEQRFAMAMSYLLNSCRVWREGGPFHKLVMAALRPGSAVKGGA